MSHPIADTIQVNIPAEPQFHCFLKLPVELRLMIWEGTMGTRVIKLVEEKIYQRFTRSNSQFVQKNKFLAPLSSWKVKSKNKVPEVIHTNRESRAVALKRYELLDKSHELKFMAALHLCPELYPFYIDFDRDVIFATNGMAFRCLCLPTFDMNVVDYPVGELDETIGDKLKHVILHNTAVPCLFEKFNKFKKLESVLIRSCHSMAPKEDCLEHSAVYNNIQYELENEMEKFCGSRTIPKLAFADWKEIEDLADEAKDGIRDEIPAIKVYNDCEKTWAENRNEDSNHRLNHLYQSLDSPDFFAGI